MALGGPAFSSICIWGLQLIHLCLCFDFFHYVSIGYGPTTWSVNSWKEHLGCARVAQHQGAEIVHFDLDLSVASSS